MGAYERHLKVWALVQKLLRKPLAWKFNIESVPVEVEGPCIVIPNHASNWDPLLVAMSFEKKHIYFVASEHIMRWGLLSKIIEYLLAPIARRKASVASDTIRAMLRHVKEGHSVCIFGEGEATWNGISNKVFPATGKMVRSSGASLVTYKLEGAYLSDPRWGKKLRRGKVRGYPVNVYTPQQLRAMTPEQINEAINRDIYENVWERQKENPVSFKTAEPALGLDRGFFLCPKCRKIGTLQSEKSRVYCSCGFELGFLDTGFLSPAEPFETLADWDAWQHEALRTGDFVREGEALFSDDNISVVTVDRQHRQKKLGEGRLIQLEDRLEAGELEIRLSDISHMDMVNTHRLLVKTVEGYYEFKAEKDRCLRKYLAVWKNAHAAAQSREAVKV